MRGPSKRRDKTAVIYVRVPLKVKADLEAYADGHDLSQAAVVNQLLQRGLAVPDDRDVWEILLSLERRLIRLENR
jgi:hypothetical protein